MKIVAKNFRLIIFFIFYCSSCTSIAHDNNTLVNNSGNITEEINEFGGITIETLNDNINKDDRWLKTKRYYDSNNNLVKVIVTPSEIVKNETGIGEQIEHYKDGNIIRYDMLYSSEHIRIHDFNIAVELLDDKGLYRTIWFINNTVVDIINYPEDMNRFTFYNLEYIENELLKVSPSNHLGDKFVTSAKYFRIRSLIKFDTNFINLNETDYKMLDYFIYSYSFPEDFVSHYKNKIRVKYRDNYYWLFIQTELEKSVKGQYATIRCYPMMWNNELYLMCVGFYDVN